MDLSGFEAVLFICMGYYRIYLYKTLRKSLREPFTLAILSKVFYAFTCFFLFVFAVVF